MRKRIIKNLIEIIIIIPVIMIAMERKPETQRVEKLQQVKPVHAANVTEVKEREEREEQQYIPKNLNYSSVINYIKREEGKNEHEGDNRTAETNIETEGKTSSERYFQTAMEYVKASMKAEDETTKRETVLKAYNYYKMYLKEKPGNLEGLLGAGTMAIYLGKEEEAKNILMEAYATYPNNPRVHKALGDYSFKFGNYNNAIEYYNLSLSSGNLEDYATNLAAAVCYEKLGDIEEAVIYYKVAKHLNPESRLANERLQMYAKMNRDGYEADTRKYEATIKIPEEEDTELQDLLFDASQIK